MAVKIPPTNFTMNLTCLTNTKKYILLYDIEEGFVFPPFCLPSFIDFLPGCRPSFEDKLPEEVCGGEKKHLNTAKTLLCVSDHV